MDNHCEENVLFWVDAEDFRIEDRKPKVRAVSAGPPYKHGHFCLCACCCCEQELREKGIEIYDKFLRQGAELEIDINPYDNPSHLLSLSMNRIV